MKGDGIVDNREPMYDDMQLEMFQQQERIELVKAVYDYSKELCEVIVDLRKEVNRLDFLNDLLSNDKKIDINEYQPPYCELYENITRTFEDYAAYEEFQSAFEDNE
jgi:hypothetical protein